MNNLCYYSEKVPSQGTIVIGKIYDESERSLFVRLPEYGNICGMIPKSDLPAKKKAFDKMLKSLLKAQSFPCTINQPVQKIGDELKLVDLTIKSIDSTEQQLIMRRFGNIEKILKMVMYVAKETKSDVNRLMSNQMFDLIKPLNRVDVSKDTVKKSYDDEEEEDEEDEMITENENVEKIDDYEKLYSKFLEDPSYFVQLLGIGSNQDIGTNQDIVQKIKGLIRETGSSSSMQIELAVWTNIENNGKDAIQNISEMFTHLISSNKNMNLTIQYKGAPTYQINIDGYDDANYISLKNQIIQWFKDNKITEYKLSFNGTTEVKKGTLNIYFPYKIDL